MKKMVPLLLLILAACIPTPTPTPTATESALPTETPQATQTPDEGTVILDGQFGDWEALPPVYSDPAGDAGTSGVDFTDIHIAHTQDLLFIKIKLGRPVNLQTEPALLLSLDTDADPEPELIFDFAAREGTFEGVPVTQSNLGLVTAPTVSSDEFEIALLREARPDGQTPLFTGEPLRLEVSDPDPAGDAAPPRGEFIEYDWSHPLPAAVPISIDKTPDSLRIVTFNVLRDGILASNRAEHFQRILTALQPDVIALQEVNNRSAASVEARIEEWLGGDWFARKQRDLITVSRFPFIEGWTDTHKPLHERIFPLMLDVDGQPLLLFNAHLSCCAANDERQDQADGFAAFLRQASIPPDTPFIFLGDLNLVGEARQLTTLLTGDIFDEEIFGPDHAPDWDGTPLAALSPRHVSANLAYTWRSDDSDFAPGRLDYIIYSDSVLSALKSFVLFTGDLSPELLAAYGLEAGDSLAASDHFPVVADMVFVNAP